MLTIDADAHVIETERTWDFLEPSDRKYRPQLVAPTKDAVREYWMIDGHIGGFRFPTLTEQELDQRSKIAGRDMVTPLAAREMDDVALRLQDMDRLGIDVQVLHNTIFIEQLTDRAEVEVALCRSWNRWLADIWKQSNGRLRWSAVPPTLSMPDALDEIRFARENGAVAVLMRPIEGARLLVDPYFYPIYDEASRLDLPIAVHIANGNPAVSKLLRSPYHLGSTFGQFRIPTVNACHSLIMSELPQVFPELRWAFIEAGSQWVPWIVTEARGRFQSQGRAFPENFLQAYRIYVTCETADDLPYVLQFGGDDNLVIGTDYGHLDQSTEVDAISGLRSLDLPAGIVEKILSVNPGKLYGIDPNAAISEAASDAA
jgi:uncharacterized protein